MSRTTRSGTLPAIPVRVGGGPGGVAGAHPTDEMQDSSGLLIVQAI